MQSFQRPRPRTIVAAAAGLAVVGAVGMGAAAFADTTPTPGASQSSTAAPSGTPSAGAPNGDHGWRHEPHIGGTVTAVTGRTVTVKDMEGFTRTIALASSVKVTKDGSTSSVSAIVKGVHILATGTVDANGTTLDATSVTVGVPTPPKGGPAGGPGRGGPGGHDGKHGPATPPSGGTTTPSSGSSTPSASS